MRNLSRRAGRQRSMPITCTFFCSALMASWTVACVVPQQVTERDSLHGQMQVAAADSSKTGGKTKSKRMTDSVEVTDGLGIKSGRPTLSSNQPSSDATISRQLPDNAPCFVRSRRQGEVMDHIFAVLDEGWGKERVLTNQDLTRFGVCINSDGPRGTVLTELVNAADRGDGNGLEVLHPTKELLEQEENGGRLALTLILPQSALLRLKPILLLSFGSSPAAAAAADELVITFTSQSLNPNTQTVCISEQTRYVTLTGKASEDNAPQSWKLFVETKDPDTGQILQEILGGGGPGSNITMTPFLLFMLDLGSDIRNTQAAYSSPGPSDTVSFLCELQRFLSEVQPESHPGSARVQLGSLQSLPSLTLGLSSSETLLVALLNSSAPTLFSFPPQGPVLQVHGGELALPPVLVEVLRQRLERAVEQMTDTMGEAEVAPMTVERLGRLKALSAFPKDEPVTGQSQYRAFLLLKALQTVARTYEVERGQRATRANQDGPARGERCGLHSLTVTLERFLVSPDSAAINNCQGICGFPVLNGNNHAILLNSQIQNGRSLERSLCCVPIAYEDLEVVELTQDGTYLSIKPNMVAKECGCR